MARTKYPREDGTWMEKYRNQLKADDPRCRRCWERDGAEVHHKIPVSDPKCVLYDEGNLILLCHECHMEIHKHDKVRANNTHHLMRGRKKGMKKIAETHRKRALARYEEVRRMHEDEGMTFAEIGEVRGTTGASAFLIYAQKGKGKRKPKTSKDWLNRLALMRAMEARSLHQRGFAKTEIVKLMGFKCHANMAQLCKEVGDDRVARLSEKYPDVELVPVDIFTGQPSH